MLFFNIPKAMYFSYKASILSIGYYKKPDIKIMGSLWNSGETGWKAKMVALQMRLVYPVKTSEMIYVPRRIFEEN